MLLPYLVQIVFKISNTIYSSYLVYLSAVVNLIRNLESDIFPSLESTSHSNAAPNLEQSLLIITVNGYMTSLF